MEIANPKRVLIVSAPNAGVESLLRELTGSAPTPVNSSLAGTSHTIDLKTSYYTTALPIWVDEIPSLDTWREEFLKTEAKEVISALGGIIYCFKRPLPDISNNAHESLEMVKNTMKAIAEVTEKALGYSWEGMCLAVVTPQSTTPYLEMEHEEWEDLCREYEFEYIDAEQKGKNQFGEQTGIPRIREALEANDWDAGDADDEFGEDEFGFDGEEAEMNAELFGMKAALQDGDDEGDAQIEEMESMMVRLQAVKEQNESLPEEQKRKAAAKAVNDIMKSF